MGRETDLSSKVILRKGWLKRQVQHATRMIKELPRWAQAALKVR